MKITIDTALDSKEHIQKTVEFLRSLVGEVAPMNAPNPMPTNSEFFRNDYRTHDNVAREAPQRPMSLNPLDFPEVQRAQNPVPQQNQPTGNVMSMFDSPKPENTNPVGNVFDLFNQEKKPEPKPEPVRIIQY